MKKGIKIIIILVVLIISSLVIRAQILDILKAGADGLEWINGQVESAMQLEIKQLAEEKKQLEEMYKHGEDLYKTAKSSKQMYELYKEKYKEVRTLKNFNWKNSYQMLSLIKNFDRPKYWLTGIADTNEVVGSQIKAWKDTSKSMDSLIENYLNASKLERMEARKHIAKKQGDKLKKMEKQLKKEYESAQTRLAKIEKNSDNKDIGSQADIISIQYTVAKKRQELEQVQKNIKKKLIEYQRLEEKQMKEIIKRLKETSRGRSKSMKIKYSYFD